MLLDWTRLHLAAVSVFAICWPRDGRAKVVAVAEGEANSDHQIDCNSQWSLG